jgi:predicted PurR-regulated permease PerM
MLAVVLILAGCYLLLHLLPLLLTLVAALMLACTLAPAIQWLEGRGRGRGMAITLVFGCFLLLAILILTLTVPALFAQGLSMLRQEPAWRERLAAFLAQTRSTASLAHSLRHFRYEELVASWGERALTLSTQVLTGLAYGVSSIFLALYFVIDRDRLRGGLFAVVPRTHHLRLGRVMLNLETIVGGYIRGQLITSALMAGFVFILLTVCQVPNALALAVFAGLADVLPYVGVFLTLLPITLAALPQGAVMTLVILAVMLAYEEFESRVLVPRIYGRALRLPSSVVLVALLAGGALMGVAGALLALPVAAALLMFLEELRIQLPGETEQPGDVQLRRDDDRLEEEYLRRAEGMPAEQAAAIAVEITDERKGEDGAPVLAEPAAQGPKT